MPAPLSCVLCRTSTSDGHRTSEVQLACAEEAVLGGRGVGVMLTRLVGEVAGPHTVIAGPGTARASVMVGEERLGVGRQGRARVVMSKLDRMVDLKSIHSRLLGSRTLTEAQLGTMGRTECDCRGQATCPEFLFPYLQSWGLTKNLTRFFDG